MACSSAALVASSALSQLAFAANGTYSNTNTGGAWSNAGNWAGGTVADGQNGIADFSTLDLSGDDTVHLDSARTIGQLKFADIVPSNNWILDNNGVSGNVLTLGVSSGSPTIMVGNDVATISAVLAGTQGMTVTGAGTLTLTNTNTFTGGTTISGGNLSLDFTQATSPATNIITSSNVLTLGGGSLTLTGKASTTNSQTFAGTSITAGLSVISANANASGNPLMLKLGTITRSAGGVVIFNQPTGTQGAANGINESTGLTNGLIGPWALVFSGGSAANNTAAGYNFAQTSSGNVTPYVAATAETSTGANLAWGGILTSGTAAANYDVSAIGPSGAGSARTANTIRYTGSGNTVPSGSVMTLNGLLNAGTGPLVVNQSLVVGSSGDLILAAEGANLVMNGILNGATGGITLAAGNGFTIALSAANTYNGPTSLVSGVTIANTLALGGVTSSIGHATNAATNLVFAGGILQYNGSSTTTDRSWTATAGNNAIFNISNPATTVTLSGGGAATTGGLLSNGPGNLTLAGTNLYTGTTNIATGSLLTLAPTGSLVSTSSLILGNNVAFDMRNFSLGSVHGTRTLTLSSLTLAGSNMIDMGLNGTATDAINLSSGTLTGSDTIAIYGAATQGQYPLLYSANGFAGGGTVTLDTSHLTPSFTPYNISNTATTYYLNVGAAAAAPATAWWTGKISLNWSDVTGAPNSNWANNSAGTSDAQQLPGSGTNVIFAAANAVTTSTNTTLGANTAIASLTFSTGNWTVADSANSLNIISTNSNGYALEVQGGTIATLAVNNTSWPGGTAVDSGGLLNVNASGGSGTGGVGGSSSNLTVNGQLNVNTSFAAGDLSGNGVVDANSGGSVTLTTGNTTTPSNTTFSGVIQNSSGSLSLIKVGTGTLTLSGSNTYSGATNISGGVVQISSAANLGVGGSLAIGNGTLESTSGSNTLNQNVTMTGPATFLVDSGTLTFGGSVNGGANLLTLTGGGNIAINGAITGTGQLVSGVSNSVIYSGSGNLNLSGTSTYTGTTNIASGTVNITGSIAGATAMTLNGSSTLNLLSAGALNAGTVLITPNATFNETVPNAVSGTAGIITQKSITLTLPNNYTGVTEISGGNGTQVLATATNEYGSGFFGFLTGETNGQILLHIDAAGNASGGTISLPNGLAGNSGLTGTIDVNNNGGGGTGNQIQLNSTTSGWANSVLNVTGGNGYSLYINKITNTAGGTGSMTFNPTSATLTIGSMSNGAAASTIILDGTATGNAITGNITNPTAAFSINKSNSSVWTISGSNSYNGSTNVIAGTLIVGSSSALPGTTAVNISGGMLDATGYSNSVGSILIGANGTLNLSAGNTFTSTYQTNGSGGVIATGNATFGGTLDVVGTPSASSYTLMHYNAFSGSFANVNIPAGYFLAYEPQNLVISLPLYFTGSAGNGNWDTSTINFNTSSGPTTYADGNAVIFDDVHNSGGQFNIAVAAGGVSPAAVSIQGSSSYTFSGGTINDNGSITMSGAATATFSNNIAGPGGVVMNGSGTLNLNGSNTYSGGTGISSGTVNANGSNALGAGAVTLSGGTLNLASATALGSAPLTLNTGTIDNTTGSTLLLNNNTQKWGGSWTFNGSSSMNMGTGAVALTAPSTVTVNNNTLTVGGQISGAFLLTTSGGGTLVLAGNSNYSGGTNVSGGTLQLAGPNAVGTGTLAMVGGNVNIADPNALGTVPLTLNSGTLDNLTGSTLTLANNNTQKWTGSWTFNGTNSLSMGTGTVAMTNNPTVTVNNNTLTVAGVISGANVGLGKSGNGMLILSGVNTYTGTTTVNAGTLQLANANALGASFSPLKTNEGTLDLNGNNISVGAWTSSSPGGVITDNSAGTGTTIFTSNNGLGVAVIYTSLNDGPTKKLLWNKVYGGTQALGGGELQMQSSSTYSGGTNLAGGAIDAFVSGALGTGPVTVNMSANNTPVKLTLESSSVVLANNIVVNYANPGTGLGVLQGSGTFGGSVTFNADATTGGDLAGPAIGQLIFTGPITLSSPATNLSVRSGNVQFSNNQSSYSVINASSGTISLGIDNGIPVNATLNMSTQAAGNPTTTTFDLNGFNQTLPVVQVNNGTGIITNSSGTPSTLTLNTASSNTYSGSITGNLTLTKNGPGALNLSGTGSSYTNGTNVNQGLVVFGGGLSNAGTGPINLNAGSGSGIIFSNTAASSVFTALQAGYNNGAWNGTGSSINSSLAAADNTHLKAVGMLQPAGSSTFLGAVLNPTDVAVKVTYYGDANLDGSVTSTDYTLIDAGYLSAGALTGWQNGDFNYDGTINGSDYTLIDNAFNMQGANLAAQIASPTAQVAGGASAVPEPTSLGLIGIGAVALLGRRRNRLARSH